MKKFIVLTLILSLFLVSFVSSEKFSIDILSFDSLIQDGEEAKYELKVTNKLDVAQSFRIIFPLGGWTVYTDPMSDYMFNLGPNEEKILNIFVSPRQTIDYRPYSVPIKLRSLTFDETKQFNLRIQFYKPEIREYVPTVLHEISISYENDPRNKIKLNVNLDNLNYRNITELNIEINSELFNKEKIIQLGPKEKKTKEFVFEVDDLISPLNDVVNVNVWAEHDEKVYRWQKSSPYRIISYYNLIEERKEETSFLKKDFFINLKSDANIEKNYEILVKENYFKGLFSSYEPSYSYIISSSEGRFLVWDINLKPQEEYQIYVKTNYRLLFVFLLVIILLIVLYFVLRPSIKVKKEVSHVGTSEGGISDIKVMLFIKNRTSKVIEDISIIEKIPHLASIGKEFQVGTLMPSKVMQNPKKGTLVKWELQTLEANEERIITYKIKSKLSILGGLTLPSTIIKYSIRGKESKTKSNKLILDI